jgi:hypothetical protein
MYTPGLKSLYKRELLVAPKTAFAIAGCPEQQSVLADDLRENAKLTCFVPTLAAIDALLGVYQGRPRQQHADAKA